MSISFQLGSSHCFAAYRLPDKIDMTPELRPIDPAQASGVADGAAKQERTRAAEEALRKELHFQVWRVASLQFHDIRNGCSFEG